MANPSHAQMMLDVELIAAASVKTILGTFSPGLVEGIKLKAAYKRFITSEDLKEKVVARFAVMLAEADHHTACQLADALVEKVGK